MAKTFTKSNLNTIFTHKKFSVILIMIFGKFYALRGWGLSAPSTPDKGLVP